MNRSKRSLSIAALVVAGLAISALVPSAAFAEAPERIVGSDAIPFVEDSSDSAELLDVQAIDGGFAYQLPTEGQGSGAALRGIGTGCQGQYLLRKVSNYIEWGASNNCTKIPDKKYLPWYIVGKLQRARVGTTSWSTVQGPFQTNDNWGKYGALATNFGCLGKTKYTYRVMWQVRYIGVTTAWWPSDSKTIECA